MTPKPCLCGCKELTKGGDFKPGHDAKYKSFLIDEALAGNNPEAEQILRERRWTHFLDKRREIESRPKREPKERKKKAPDLRAADILRLMKAASKVLRWTGQYRRGTLYSITITAENALDIARLRYPELRLPRDDSTHEPFTDLEQRACDLAASTET